MTKNTVYQKSFYAQEPMKSVVLVSKEYDQLKGPHLEMSSTYKEGFYDRKGDEIERPKPEDLLSSEGPAQELTSYGAQFPGHHGENQYVKPTDRHLRGNFPLRSKSTYAGNFMRRPAKKDDYKYIPDQLKTGIYNWLGSSTYSNNFVQPNPEYMAKKVKNVEKKEEKANNKLQFRTTYKSDFMGKGEAVCPAKVQLSTKSRGSYSEVKHRFSENSDFKTISRNFAAISTSKHSYI